MAEKGVKEECLGEKRVGLVLVTGWASGDIWMIAIVLSVLAIII